VLQHILSVLQISLWSHFFGQSQFRPDDPWQGFVMCLYNFYGYRNFWTSLQSISFKVPRFFALLTGHPSIIFVNKPTWGTNISCMIIYILYMFRATTCPSSGESTVSIRYLVYEYVTLYGRPSGMQEHMFLHTKRSSTQSDIYQVSHWYSWFSWWWARGCPKHVENRNNHTWKICASSWFVYKDYLIQPCLNL